MMSLNPFTALKNAFSGASEVAPDKSMVPAGDQDATPATPTTKDAELVEGTFVPTGTETTIQLTNASARTEHVRRIVESFDEDKLDWQEWAVKQFFTVCAYVGPVIVAWWAGLAIGDAYGGGPFTLASAYNAFIHIVSLVGELALAMLVYGAASCAKRIKSKRSPYIAWFIVVTLFFLIFAVGSAIAQYIMLEQHGVALQAGLAQYAGIVRVSIAPAADLACLIFLSVTRLKSLQKFLQDQEAKREGIELANASEIRIEQTQMKAAMDMQAALMDMQSKQQRAATWNEIESMQSQAMIEQAKRNMRNDDDGLSGSGVRRGRY